MKDDLTIRPDTARRHTQKFENQNYFHRKALSSFYDTFAELLRPLFPEKVLDFGCGEGYALRELRRRGFSVPEYLGIDIREEALRTARTIHPDLDFRQMDLFDPQIEPGSFDLIICSEVLEHLNHPEKYLQRMVDLQPDHLLITVPWEPWFRLMNLIRGRDILRLGNHPEHVNHWNERQLRRWVSGFFPVRSTVKSFPFLLLHGSGADEVNQ